jgi:hypothetical protein
MKVRTPGALLILCAFMMLLLPVPCAHAAGNSIVLCRIGDSAPQAWSLLRQHFEGKGYQVTFYQGEATIEGHVEKVNGINRGSGRIFLAVELIPAAHTQVMVAMTDAKKGEGRFLTIDQIPERFAGESEKLAGSIAAPFKVKVKHLPLFPLLGVNMPGVFVRMQFKEVEFEDGVNKLYSGIERYFTERATK